jgi:hypothetical protein
MAKQFADIIRERLPHVLTDVVVILAIIFVLYLVMPIAYVTGYVIPGIGLAGGMLVGIGALIISLMVEARLYRNLEALSDSFASYMVDQRKHLTPKRKEEIRGAFANLGKVVTFLILLALISPVLIIIPGIGVIAVAIPLMAVFIVVVYGWGSWEIVKEELEKIFKTFSESFAKTFEK